MENKFNKGIKNLQDIQMTAKEKEVLFKRIQTEIESPLIKTERKIVSPWNIQIFGTWLHTSRITFAGACSLIITLTGGTLAYAAESSLPGDALYSVKVKVTEPVRDILNTDLETQAKWQAKKAERRMEESEILSVEGRLDSSKEEEVKKLITKHTEKLSKSLDTLRKQNSEVVADNIGAEFQVEMNAHAELLDTLEVKAPQMAKMMSVETASFASFSEPVKGIAETARENAKDVAEKISKRKRADKKSLESIIEKTSSDIEGVSINEAPFREKVIRDTRDTLNQAKQFLKESIEQDNKGEREKSNNSLLDSSRKIEEARVFMKRGLELDRQINTKNKKDKGSRNEDEGRDKEKGN